MKEPTPAQDLFKGRHFDQEIIILCVRWYITFKLSFRDLVQMMAERGITLCHTTILRWVQQYVQEFEKRWNHYARPVGDSWRVSNPAIARNKSAGPRGMTRLVDDPESKFEVSLISRIADGDESAFAALYQRLSSSLYGLAYRMMNDAKEAEDVLQEGFTYIWRRAGSYDPTRSTPFAWAVMIVRNTAIDRLRVRQRGERLRERVEQSVGQERDESSAEEPALRERSAIVRSALEQIPREQREALELAFFGGLTHEEIADRLTTPLGTIKARIRRGLLKLREFLQEEA